MSGRYALIIAADDYTGSSFAKLRAPLNDAEELAGVLRNPGIGEFEVDRLLNQAAPTAKTEIERFFQHRDPDDLLLLYFSCHGYKDEDGSLYLAMPNTQTALLDSTAIESSFINKQIEKTWSRKIVLILDCCYSGAFARGFAMKSGDVSNRARETFKGEGRVVITSSDALQYSFEEDQVVSGRPEMGVFTEAVVRGLRTGDADLDGDGWVSTDDLYRFTEQEVLAVSSKQRPTILKMVKGDIYLAKSRSQRGTGTDQPSSEVAVGAEKTLTADQATVPAPTVDGHLRDDSLTTTDAVSYHYNRAVRFAQDGDRVSAEAEFNQVISTTSTRLAALAQFNLAVLASKAGNAEEASVRYEAAANSGLQIVAALATLNLGCLRFIAGRDDEAAALLREAMNYPEDDVRGRAAYLLGLLSEQSGDISEAWLMYGAASDYEGQPFDAEARARYADLLGQISDIAMVTRVLIMANYPKPIGNALIACGSFYLQRGQAAKARECYRRLAGLDDPEFTEVANEGLTQAAKVSRSRWIPWKSSH